MWGLKARHFGFLVTLPLAACAAGIRLSDADRTELRRQSVVHVLHYESHAPRIETSNKAQAPHPSAVRRHAAADPAALEAARRAARLAEDAGLREPYAEALNAEAIVHQTREDFAKAIPLLERMLEITADAKGQGIALQNLGSIAAQQGDFARARRFFLRSHRCFEQAGYTHGVAFVLNNFGRAALDHANARVAIPMLEDALGAARRVGDHDLEAIVHRNLAEAAVAIDDRDGAHTHLEAAERTFAAAGNRARLVECLRLRGELAEREMGSDAAREQYRLAHALAAEVGALGEVARLLERLTALGDAAPDDPPARAR